MNENEKTNDTTVVPTPQLPHDAPKIGETVRYDFLGAIWRDEVVAVDMNARMFWVRQNGAPLPFRAWVR